MATNTHIIYIFIIIIISYYCLFLYNRNKKLKNYVNTDYKTGLFNYPGAKKLFENELSLLNRFEEKYFLYFAMFDMDNFKEHNNEYGHISADSKIVDLANILKKYFSRKEDVIFRFGGDEFGIFFFTKKFNTENAAESMDNVKRDFLKINKDTNLSVSSGSVLLNNVNITDFEKCVNFADENLLKVKNTSKGNHIHSEMI